jgi:hypothetical protein
MFFHITLFLIYSSFIRYCKYTPYKLKQEKSLLDFVLFNERQPPKQLLLALYIVFGGRSIQKISLTYKKYSKKDKKT